MDYNNERRNGDYNPTYIRIEPRAAASEPAAAPEQPRKKRRTGIKVVALVLVAVLLVGAGGVGGALVLDQLQGYLTQPAGQEIAGGASEGTAAPEEGDAVQASGTVTPAPVNPALKTFSQASSAMTSAEIYAAYVGSVVAISTETTYANYFGQTSTYASAGTGFILTEDGYILTNNHVVSGGDTVTVTLFNEDSYPARVVGADAENDIAVLKIETTGLAPVNLGDSDEIVVGEDVAVIGNPLGELTNSLTVGVVSATDRLTNIDGTPINMFQIDAAVNSGNSGGPVFDATGRVIGVVAAKYADTGIEGLGFAIPINDAINVAQSLITYGYVTGRPALSIMVKTVDSTTAAYYNFPLGSMVMEITEGGAADKAGLQEGDIITALGDYEVTSNEDLSAAKLEYSAYDTTTITVYRAGEYLELTITFDEVTNSAETTTGGSTQDNAFGNGNVTIIPPNGQGDFPYSS